MADASKLYIDPTPAYKPTLDFLQGQEKLANARYGKNKADISNIFGTLTSLTEKDAARIEDQFVQSVKDQQQGLAQRTAEVRATQGTARQAMQDVGAERGNGPMSVGPTAVDTTAEQGIATSNEYQTTWDALMNVNKQQAQENLRNRIAGYGQQEAGALTALQQNLENRLSELSGSRAQVMSDISKAKLAGKENVATAGYNTQVALETAAASKTPAAPEAKTENIQQWAGDIEATNPGASGNIIKVVGNLYNTLVKRMNKKTDVPGFGSAGETAAVKPTKADLMAEYIVRFGTDPLSPYGVEYINKYFGLK